jgi:hypothetical protein
MSARKRMRFGTCTIVAALLAAAAAVLLVEPCLAQETDEGHRRLARFLDADDDHQVDSEELDTGKELAAALCALDLQESDSDGDGVLSLDELSAALDDAVAAAQEEADENAEAESAVAQALGLRVLLDQLAAQEQYAEEVARLREAVEHLDDEEATVQYLITNSTSYPRLYPTVRLWARHYPIKPGIRRRFASDRLPPRHHGPQPKPKPKPAATPPKPPKPCNPGRP